MSYWDEKRRMQDAVDVDVVEVTVDRFGKMWINIDGACALRVGHINALTIEDPIRGAYQFNWPLPQ